MQHTSLNRRDAQDEDDFLEEEEDWDFDLEGWDEWDEDDEWDLLDDLIAKMEAEHFDAF